MAAVRACDDDAVLSHVAAAALWGLLKPIAGPIDVSVPSHNGRLQREGIRLHRCGSLAADPRRRDGLATLVTVRNRIPVTTVPRTIDDLRDAVSQPLLRRAIRQAQLMGHALDPARTSSTRRTRSDVELDFLALCQRHGIARDLDLRERGYATRRFTASQLYDEPERVAADVAAGLAEGARRG